jgi:hypothetical protein
MSYLMDILQILSSPYVVSEGFADQSGLKIACIQGLKPRQQGYAAEYCRAACPPAWAKSALLGR